MIKDGEGERDGGPGEGDGEMRNDERDEFGGARADMVVPVVGFGARQLSALGR